MRPSLLIHGNAAVISSFALVNRRLAAGLRRRGWRVTLVGNDDPPNRRPPRLERPDVYLSFGYPYDLLNAPGRVNAFYLSYDYATFEPRHRDLAARLNLLFDVVLVPSAFTAEVCRRNGVSRPIVVCPHGVDPREFRPPTPREVEERRDGPFDFLALGGAYERKGTDLLLRAYRRTFRAGEPVRLVVKAFAYELLLPWVRRRLAPFERPRTPALVFEHSVVRSVAPYYRRADAGVFPYRGEAFAMTVLECLASGTPVLATRGCAPPEYARQGATWIPAIRSVRRGRDELEPDVQALGRLMREAYERGKPSHADRARVARAVRAWTWDRAVAIIDRTLRTRLRAAAGRSSAPLPRRKGRAPAAAPVVAFAHHSLGTTSWRLSARHVGRALASRTPRLSVHGWLAPRPDPAADVLVGQSEYSLEAFQASVRRRPDARRVLYRESAPAAAMVAISSAERRACGAQALRTSPMIVWRNAMEYRLADRIVVPSRGTRDRFVSAGLDPARLRVVPSGITLAGLVPARMRTRLRVLFSASDPFRKGVRTLFEAWRLAALPRADLLCVASRDLLTSPRLLAGAVADPSIRILPFLPHRRFLSLYEEVDCVVLPTFEDGFSYDVADALARGLPCIVSDQAGIHELLTHGDDAWIVPAGRPEALAEALGEMASSRSRRAAMGRRARDTARQWTWRRFEEAFAEAVFA